MKETILKLKEAMLNELNKAEDLDSIENIRVKYLGKNSEINRILKSIKNLSNEQKKILGPLANVSKKEMLYAVKDKKDQLEEAFNADKEWIDVTLPGKKVHIGSLNPLTLVQNDIEDIFVAMGFEIADGPEIDTEFYNFDGANMPKNHPARDMQDTFWIKQSTDDEDGFVLRTHTTNCQVRYMEKNKPPFRIIIPGRVFRQESTDASHEHTFHQFEALVVGDSISVANFLDIANKFFSAFFKKDIKVRLRPSYFPFVEPGFEFDISCTNCDGVGCSACKQTGWLEVGGAGMVHQNVFVASGYPRDKYKGFAWGFGLERLAMMKYKINDIRLFHSGDIRLGKQFV